MTDNQFNQLFDALTELLRGIERVEQIMKEPKSNVPERKSRIESQNRLSNVSLDEPVSESLKACLKV